jgi:RNA polymerase sigma-70 factor (ECF subfamily)
MRDYYNRQEELNEEHVDEDRFEEAGCREEYMEVQRVFFELPKEDRLIVGMHVFLGYKTREIAEILSMNENTVRSRKSRAIRWMGVQLEGLR